MDSDGHFLQKCMEGCGSRILQDIDTLSKVTQMARQWLVLLVSAKWTDSILLFENQFEFLFG